MASTLLIDLIMEQRVLISNVCTFLGHPVQADSLHPMAELRPLSEKRPVLLAKHMQNKTYRESQKVPHITQEVFDLHEKQS